MIRPEPWGRVEYDPQWDEFEAQVCDDPLYKLDRPLSAGCLVTGSCNLECEFCYGNHENLPAAQLTVQAWDEIFRHLKSWGLMRVDLSGGEPTLRKDLPEIARAAIEAGLCVVISTNGLVLYKDGPSRLPKDVRIHVSIDSGFAAVHELSRRGRNLKPSPSAFSNAVEFVRKCVDAGYRLRVLTCIGRHNAEGLFELGETLALHGVKEWNISRILPAGRALEAFQERWNPFEETLIDQVNDMREAYHWMRIGYSNRIEQDGYFLLILPDGTAATQYTDRRDKVPLGRVLEMTLADLQDHPAFHLEEHARKWIGASLYCQDRSCPLCYLDSGRETTGSSVLSTVAAQAA